MNKILFMFSVLGFMFAATAADFKVSPTSSQVGFEIIKFKIGSTVTGNFKTFSGLVKLDEGKGEIQEVDVNIDTASINTEDEKRDEHLRSPDFFNAEKFPKITFKSKAKVTIAKTFDLKGDFTINGVTKPVTLKVTKPDTKQEGYVFDATTVINRLDYGITWNKALEESQWKTVLGVLGKTVIDDKVTIKLKIELEK